MSNLFSNIIETVTVQNELEILQWVPLNVIALGQAISDYNNQMVTLSILPFPLNEDSFKKLAKTAKIDYIIQLITLSVIPLSGAHCIC
jgi:hypothetical protein